MNKMGDQNYFKSSILKGVQALQQNERKEIILKKKVKQQGGKMLDAKLFFSFQ